MGGQYGMGKRELKNIVLKLFLIILVARGMDLTLNFLELTLNPIIVFLLAVGAVHDVIKLLKVQI